MNNILLNGHINIKSIKLWQYALRSQGKLISAVFFKYPEPSINKSDVLIAGDVHAKI